MEINFISKVSDEELEDISGGVCVDKSSYCAYINSVTLSREEFNKLKDEGYLKDGELRFNSVDSAVRCLEKNGYSVSYINSLGAGGLASDAAGRVRMKLEMENPAIKLIIE